MSARTFLESSWFKLLWKGVIIVGIPALSVASGYAGWTLSNVYTQQSSLTDEVASIQDTQADRAALADDRSAADDRFKAEIVRDVAAVDTKVEKIDDAVAGVQLNVANIMGILTEMQRQDVAATRLRLP